jgi:hypothetical protein
VDFHTPENYLTEAEDSSYHRTGGAILWQNKNPPVKDAATQLTNAHANARTAAKPFSVIAASEQTP